MDTAYGRIAEVLRSENSVIGKTDMEIQKNPELVKMFYEQDKEIMRTGKMSHCYCEFNDSGKKSI